MAMLDALHNLKLFFIKSLGLCKWEAEFIRSTNIWVPFFVCRDMGCSSTSYLLQYLCCVTTFLQHCKLPAQAKSITSDFCLHMPTSQCKQQSISQFGGTESCDLFWWVFSRGRKGKRMSTQTKPIFTAQWSCQTFVPVNPIFSDSNCSLGRWESSQDSAGELYNTLNRVKNGFLTLSCKLLMLSEA